MYGAYTVNRVERREAVKKFAKEVFSKLYDEMPASWIKRKSIGDLLSSDCGIIIEIHGDNAYSLKVKHFDKIAEARIVIEMTSSYKKAFDDFDITAMAHINPKFFIGSFSVREINEEECKSFFGSSREDVEVMEFKETDNLYDIFSFIIAEIKDVVGLK